MKISFGLIGYGKIGERHAEHISAHPEGELSAVWDIRPARMTRLNRDYPATRVCENLADLLQDPTLDLVSICTPNASHAELAIQALEAGKHVLVEKPMALRTADCRAMIEAAAQNAKSLFVVKQNRFNPPVQAVRKLIDAGRLGRIYTVTVNCYWNRNADYYRQSDWKGRLALDGGTLFTQFSHFVDVLYYLLGDMDILHARMDNMNHAGLIEFEDTGVVSFILRDHQAPGVLHYTTSAYDHNMEGSITVFAEHATIRIGGKYLNEISYQATAGFDIHLPGEPGAPNRYGAYEGSMSNHDKVIDNVIRALQGRDQIMTRAEDGLRTVDIIERIYAIANPVNHV